MQKLLSRTMKAHCCRLVFIVDAVHYVMTIHRRGKLRCPQRLARGCNLTACAQVLTYNLRQYGLQDIKIEICDAVMLVSMSAA